MISGSAALNSLLCIRPAASVSTMGHVMRPGRLNGPKQHEMQHESDYPAALVSSNGVLATSAERGDSGPSMAVANA